MECRRYRVKIQNDDGEIIFRGFDTIEQARELYDILDGKAEIQQYHDTLGDYEIVVYPTFEY